MINYKVNLAIVYSHCGSAIVLTRSIDLPFVPYFGLTIISYKDGDLEFTIDENNTSISYNLEEGFYIEKHENLSRYEWKTLSEEIHYLLSDGWIIDSDYSRIKEVIRYMRNSTRVQF